MGSTVVFICNVSVTDDVNCKWKHNGKDMMTNANSSSNMSLELFDVNLDDGGIYTCEIMRDTDKLLVSSVKLRVLGKLTIMFQNVSYILQ